MPEREEIAWAAGLFEGEGCIAIRPQQNRNYPHIALQLNMVDEEPVRAFARIVGCGTLNWYHPPSHKNRKGHWLWRCGASKDVVKVGELLLPYLHPRRKKKMLEGLAICRKVLIERG